MFRSRAKTGRNVKLRSHVYCANEMRSFILWWQKTTLLFFWYVARRILMTFHLIEGKPNIFHIMWRWKELRYQFKWHNRVRTGLKSTNSFRLYVNVNGERESLLCMVNIAAMRSYALYGEQLMFHKVSIIMKGSSKCQEHIQQKRREKHWNKRNYVQSHHKELD